MSILYVFLFSADRTDDAMVLPELDDTRLTECVPALFEYFWDTFFLLKF